MEDNWKSHNGEWDKEHLGSKSVMSNNSGFQGNRGYKKGEEMSTRTSGEKGKARKNAAESIQCFRRKKGDICSVLWGMFLVDGE